MPEPVDHRIERFMTRRTGRCAACGPTDPATVRELWVVLHGYGQLASRFLAGFGTLDDGSRLIVAPITSHLPVFFSPPGAVAVPAVDAA